MNRGDLQELAEQRLEDARVLLRNGRSAAAYYLVGYSVECALKACIARKTKQHDFPELEVVKKSYTHSLQTLAEVAGLLDVLKEPPVNSVGGW